MSNFPKMKSCIYTILREVPSAETRTMDGDGTAGTHLLGVIQDPSGGSYGET